jgi:hypothetical protein
MDQFITILQSHTQYKVYPIENIITAVDSYKWLLADVMENIKAWEDHTSVRCSILKLTIVQVIETDFLKIRNVRHAILQTMQTVNISVIIIDQTSYDGKQFYYPGNYLPSDRWL